MTTADLFNSKEILIVEDDNLIRESLVEFLELEGFKVHNVSNGQEALIHLQTSKYCPALILLDLMMPVMDGYQFRKEQLQDPLLTNIPVIIISADTYSAQKAEKIMPQAWVKKPLEISELLEVINRYI